MSDILIRALRNRHERRNKRGDLMQHTYTLPFQNIRDEEYLEEIKNAYMALGGPLHSFLVKDYWDFEAVNTSLGVAPSGSTPIQLQKVYTFGTATYARPITKPVVSGAVIRQAGTPKDGTLNPLTGMFTPSTAWTPGEALTADFEFRVPVRFSDFTLVPSIDSRSTEGFAMNGSCSLIEVFGE